MQPQEKSGPWGPVTRHTFFFSDALTRDAAERIWEYNPWGCLLPGTIALSTTDGVSFLKKLFGERLRALRQLANLTQLELAELVGISDRYLGRVERGLVSPSFDCIERIAQALNTRPANLFLFTPAPAQPAPGWEDLPPGQSFLHVSHAGVWECKGPDRPCRLSASLKAMLGYPASHTSPIARKRLLGHVLEEDRPTALALLASADAMRSHPLTALRIVRRGGEMRQVLVMVEAAPSPGEEGGVMGVAMDVTDQRRFDELLAASKDSLESMIRDRTAHLVSTVARLEGEASLRAMTERSLRLAEREKATILSSLDSVLIKHVTPGYEVIWTNQTASAAGDGIEPGKPCHAQLMKRDTPCPGCPVSATLAKGRPANGELQTPDGRHWLTRATPVLDDDGQISSVLFVGFDVTERVKASIALENAVQERSALLKSFSGMTVKCVDSRMRLLWASSGDPDSPANLGEKFVGQYCFKAFQDQDTPCPGCQLPESLSKGRSYEGEINTPNGRTHLVRCNPLRAKDGSVKGAVQMSFDITERKLIEQNLERTRRFLEHLLSSSSAVIFTSGPGEGQGATYVSDNIREIFGLDPEQLIGNHNAWAERLYPGELERMRERRHLLFETGRLENVFRFRHGNGSWRWTRVDLKLLRDQQGQPLEIVGSWFDITESKACELSLRESESRYRNLFLSNRTVQLIIDADTGAILDANPAAETFYGYPLETLKALNISQINELPTDSLFSALWEARDGKRNFFKFRHRLANGDVREVESRVSHLTHNGRPVIHSMIIDVTTGKAETAQGHGNP